uniref:Uncharacterized protein n=1 Tax=Anguilla anguilla TaxID=7936 RepID=A0A0E9RIX3_ANGAN
MLVVFKSHLNINTSRNRKKLNKVVEEEDKNDSNTERRKKGSGQVNELFLCHT